ncbi:MULTISPECIES: SsrA-binding protein SmpB [unclassified Lentimonas]|uniref:SsrA-binding protein SmpB n=1 Tax=unclassified Lentimonas TaxID=2630993 RepID=UPI00132999A2|nr:MULTISPECIES: SsrA-binding protein SmpB [unclassified Lentimonas]CAA6678730.1 tmRNA-binding protein SmpB [Lentimonas sp. CC4]CAA6683716.1 tmRNA-binding protein SmpB [Lentimonas sp. CC6]CAA6691352.1 tmRNA-binding protein SmpB [Lentimonas sp. CC19]CAA6694904.1 tmRNA-binding protein SmpB [Lentimonas sp. CC10]CAA7071904.1 tmRNA-binding protein SmpB [Lentimonas sp. CC11]
MCAKKKSPEDRFKEIRNGKAHHNYFVGDSFEAGIVLQGTEVKAVRAGDAQITEGFCRIEKGECWLYNSHIGEYKFGNFANHPPRRKRKLILHRREIHKIFGAMEAGGKSLIPLRMYLKHGLIKVEIALCTGKKLFDKRETLKKKITMREAEREMRHHK